MIIKFSKYERRKQVRILELDDKLGNLKANIYAFNNCMLRALRSKTYLSQKKKKKVKLGQRV